MRRMKTTEADSHIRPGDVYKYSCGNDQGYGYMVPVKTSDGWDFIDTYQLDFPSMKPDETSDEASVRNIIELGISEHDGYVRRMVYNFYHKNAIFCCKTVPSHLVLVFNVSDYDIVSRRRCEDYDCADVVMDVPLYREQHFDWTSGLVRGLCFVRKGAVKSRINEYRSLLREASSLIISPDASGASSLLGKIEKRLYEIKSVGLSTPQDELEFAFLVRRTEIINKCVEDLREVSKDYLVRLRIFDSMNGEETEDNV